jgi:CubicO group peptidase (beta-lactamase class C family)
MLKKGFILILIKTAFFSLFFLWDIIVGGADFFEGDGGVHALEKRSGYHITNDFSKNKNFTDFENRLATFMRRQHIKGASVGIVKDGKLVYARGLGYADEEKGIEAQPYHMFRLASISKLITSTAIMQLNEKGLLSLDEKVFGEEGILNDSIFLDIYDPKVKDITVRHLLNHTGGWSVRGGDPLFMPGLIARVMDEPLPINEEVITRFMLQRRRLAWRPGTRSAYSNYGYIALGMVIERKAGMPYTSYVQKHILDPLGIHDMHMGSGLPSEQYPLETSYYVPENEMLIRPFYDATTDTLVQKAYGGNDIGLLGAAGGWVGSSIAIMKFLTAIDGFNERPDILSRESIEEMTANKDNLGPLGWRGVNQKNWWRTGSFSGTSTLLVRQENNVSWVVLFNTSNWRGPRLSQMLYNFVSPSIDHIDEWPEHDLFVFSSPHFSAHLR